MTFLIYIALLILSTLVLTTQAEARESYVFEGVTLPTVAGFATFTSRKPRDGLMLYIGSSEENYRAAKYPQPAPPSGYFLKAGILNFSLLNFSYGNDPCKT